MTQAEQLDALLLSLYRHKQDKVWHSINKLCARAGIKAGTVADILILVTRLVSDGHITANAIKDDVLAQISEEGIAFCEQSSYQEPGNAISQKYLAILHRHLDNVQHNLSASFITEGLKSDLRECLVEIEDFVDAGKKPEYCLNQLVDLTREDLELQEQAKTLRDHIMNNG